MTTLKFHGKVEGTTECERESSLLSAALQAKSGYPEPTVVHALARARFLDTAKAHLGRRDLLP